jgi:hypothetical protein
MILDGEYEMLSSICIMEGPIEKEKLMEIFEIFSIISIGS